MKNFIIEQIQLKLMTSFFFKLKKPLILANFQPISPIFRAKKYFQKIGVSCTTL